MRYEHYEICQYCASRFNVYDSSAVDKSNFCSAECEDLESEGNELNLDKGA